MAEKLKHYTEREELLNAWTHIVGVFLGIAGIIPLLGVIKKIDQAAFAAGVIFYWISILTMFGASSYYHLCRSQWHKLLARKFDHCAIYLLITGTYAPLITGVVKTLPGYIILWSLVGLTFSGILEKCFFANKLHHLEVIIYIAMGWACILIIGNLISGMTPVGLWLLISGGVAYTGGVVFYVIHKEFFHALWHLFVLTGAILHYFAILTIGNI